MPAVKYTPFTPEQAKAIRGHRFNDLTDRRFASLYVIRPVGHSFTRQIVWECLCDCGKLTTVQSGNLRCGSVKSCGCQKGGPTRFTRKHGLTLTATGSKILRAWNGMLGRCCDPREDAYKYYGGRGIKVCRNWATSVTHFARDIGKPPSPKHSIDRVDNSGHYSCGHCSECVGNGWPRNVRWATQQQQMRNFRLNRKITAFGQTKLLVEWAETVGLDSRTIDSRLKRGWSPEDAVSLARGFQSYKARQRLGDLISLLPDS